MKLAKRGMIALFAFGLVMIGGQNALQAATELARINSTVINLEDFNKRYQETLKYFQFRAPSKSGVLDDVIKRELGIQEAKRLGLDKDPEIIERMNTVLYQSLIDRQITKEFAKTEIKDEDAKAFYERYPEINTSQIFIAVPPNSKPEVEKDAKKRIEFALNELRIGEKSFAEIAQRHSEGITAAMGGVMDFQTREKLGPIYYDTARRLKTGQHTLKEIRTELGYHIIKLTGVRDWEDADKKMVKQAMLEQRRFDLFEKYMKELRGKAKVTVRNELIKE